MVAEKRKTHEQASRACLMFHKSKNYLRIKKIEIYRTDATMTYTSPYKPPEGGGKRGKVTELSRKSLQKLAFYAQNTDVCFTTIITLTYPGEYPKSGKEIKEHLNRFLAWMRGKFKSIQYLWFLEFQSRGAPHFHVLLDLLLTGYKSEISTAWYKAVGSGDERHLRAGTNTEKIRKVDGAARYAAKYAAKREQKSVPGDFADVGRFWGASRKVKPKAIKEYNLEGMVGTELQEFLRVMGWSYSETLVNPLKVLYNAGKLFT